jgi:hypothetical protein
MLQEALRRRTQASIAAAVQARLRAQRLIHEARNIRQRIAGRRFLASLHPK